jgi:acyl-CoA thioester hydrolase
MTASIAWDRTNPFTTDVQAGPEHVDGYGHVSTPNYVGWMIDCAFAHSSELGLPESRCREINRGMAVVHMDMDLVGSAYDGDSLTVATWITHNDGKLRLSRHLQIVNSESGRTLARADIDFVCTNLETGRPVRLPPEFVSGYKVVSEPQ